MYRQIIDIDNEIISTNTIRRESDKAFIPCDEQNMDYQAYLAWIAEGNIILPPEE